MNKLESPGENKYDNPNVYPGYKSLQESAQRKIEDLQEMLNEAIQARFDDRSKSLDEHNEIIRKIKLLITKAEDDERDLPAKYHSSRS